MFSDAAWQIECIINGKGLEKVMNPTLFTCRLPYKEKDFSSS